MSKWAFKIRRYDGSDSVLALYDTRELAQADVTLMNAYEQTDQYYAEQWEPNRAERAE